jgi:hypothetical protein
MDELQQERKALRQQIAQMDEEELLSLDSVLGDKGKGSFDITSLLSLLPIEGPLLSNAMTLLRRLLHRKSKKEHKEKAEGHKHNIFYRAGKDMLMGYVKWKAVEWSFKGMRYLVQQRKRNKA